MQISFPNELAFEFKMTILSTGQPTQNTKVSVMKYMLLKVAFFFGKMRRVSFNRGIQWCIFPCFLFRTLLYFKLCT